MRQVSDVTGFLEHPVKGVSSAFAVLFAISCVLHVWQSSKYKSWFYTWFLPCACIIFTASFICREYTAFHPTSGGTFSAIRGLFYSGVPVITVPLYFFQLRLLVDHGSVIPIRPAYLGIPAICLSSVIISLVAQGASSFFNPDATDGSVSAGLGLLKASLILQLFLNVTFIAVTGIFHRQCSLQGIFQKDGGQRIPTITSTLSISLALVLICNLFSTIQIFLPSDSPVWTDEAYFWVFDAAPMLACTALLHVFPPAKYFQSDSYAARSATDCE